MNYLKKYTLKNFENFLWYLSTINFFSWYSSLWNSSTMAKFQYPKSDISLHIFETVINYNIVCEKLLFTYFRQQMFTSHLFQKSNLSWISFSFRFPKSHAKPNQPNRPFLLSLSLFKKKNPKNTHSLTPFLYFLGIQRRCWFRWTNNILLILDIISNY